MCKMNEIKDETKEKENNAVQTIDPDLKHF